MINLASVSIAGGRWSQKGTAAVHIEQALRHELGRYDALVASLPAGSIMPEARAS